MLYFSAEQVVFQEVPGEVSLAFTISGCSIGCKGCHSTDSWSPTAGQPLTDAYFHQRLQDYQGLISCVLFLGGEWKPAALIAHLAVARNYHLHTCLYTGLDEVSAELKAHLTYLKTGRWEPERGGLNSLTTNQRFVDLRTHECLNYRFTNHQ